MNDSVDQGEPAVRRERGRPRSFDMDKTTEAALLLFWQQGFEATTLEEITERTGINGSSLFAAYGNKHGLFMAALQRYRATISARLSDLEFGEQGIDDLITFLRWLTNINTSADRPLGCLMVNTMVEFGTTDQSIAEQVALYRDQLIHSIRAALVRASKMNEIPDESIATRTQLVHAGLFGALVIANFGSSRETHDAFNALVLEVQGWRIRGSVTS